MRNHRRRFWISILVCVCGMVAASGHLTHQWPTWMQLMGYVLSGVLCAWVVRVWSYNHYAPYAYVLSSIVWIIGLVLFAGSGLPVSFVVTYVTVGVTILLLWTLSPGRIWSIVLMICILLSLMLSVPRHPTEIHPLLVRDLVPPLQIQRQRQLPQEEVMVYYEQNADVIPSGETISLWSTSGIIDYSSPHKDTNTLSIHTNNGEHIHVGSQSTFEYMYRDGELGWVSDTHRVTVSGLIREQRNHIIKEIRPSSWSHTGIGATILQYKLRLMTIIDKAYEKDLQTHFSYQCLVYGWWCDRVGPERSAQSLGYDHIDSALLQTIRSVGDVDLRDR